MVARWYVLSFQPGRENVAELNLRRQGFETWMPRQVRVVRHARRQYERCVPFFPGYMFVLLDLHRDRWRQIHGTLGVRSLIMQGERQVPCPVGLVERLHMVAASGGALSTAETLALGERVRITSGPFAEAVGTPIQLDGAGRVRILMEMMQSEIAVSLRVHEVIPALRSPRSAVAMVGTRAWFADEWWIPVCK